ncbi:MAG TPA: lactate racemase domain-containing protein [Candidatus Bathyarchaeia archaeon]|nr:lactate racemase domain-containing protein [Candidatus Bathyarchaeia archaeon]
MARPEAKLKELKPAELRHEVGARKDLVVTLNRRSEHRLIAYGEDFLFEKLPAGTRVIYPAPPLDPLADPDQAIRYALLRPENADPLFAQLDPNMRVTIAIDDISLPLPPMRRPDIRERILNQLLQTLADYGVDDVHLILATSLHRRMTEAEIRRAVGERAFRQFWPERLYNFDAENRSELTMLGKTDHGEEVWLSKRAAESDLLLYVNINLVPMDGGHKSVAVGLAPYQSLRHHHNAATLRDSHSYMDPTRSALHRSADRMGAVVNQNVKVFTIETAINSNMYGSMLDFLHKNEDQFSEWDHARLSGFRWTLRNMSNDLRRQALHRYTAPYGMTGVWAGETQAVHQKALAKVYQQYAVPVKGQSDILIVGVPYISPYNVSSIMNPVLVQCMGLGYLFNMYRNKPLVRQGGTMIVCHPLRDEFQPEHHPSYIEFFHRCLAETNEATELEERFEREFARNPTYIHMYRYGHAYHGVHPFYMWYWGEPARQHVGRVIVAGCEEPAVAARMGWEAADTLDQAIAMATSELGRSASITYLHLPPIVIADVD